VRRLRREAALGYAREQMLYVQGDDRVRGQARSYRILFQFYGTAVKRVMYLNTTVLVVFWLQFVHQCHNQAVWLTTGQENAITSYHVTGR
jgi:hypothetical protein